MEYNILCTSKPGDGLLYYSYEYCCYMNSIGIDTQLVIIPHPGFNRHHYDNVIKSKYTIYENVTYDCDDWSDVTIVMGRSLITIGYISRDLYTREQLELLRLLLSGTVVSVYSDNRADQYTAAAAWASPNKIIDVCDKDVYPNGVGNHFEKRIFFDIYRPVVDDVKFKYLFNGTSRQYYADALKVIDKYESHGILVYDSSDVDSRYNNVVIPVVSLPGMFDTYVYTKETIDPAPRIIQECKYYNKEIILEKYNRGVNIYLDRECKQPDVSELINVG